MKQVAVLFVRFIFEIEYAGNMFLRNVSSLSTDYISQKIKLFTSTAVRNSNTTSLVKVLNIKFNENPFIGSKVVTCGGTGKETDMAKPVDEVLQFVVTKAQETYDFLYFLILILCLSEVTGEEMGRQTFDSRQEKLSFILSARRLRTAL
jgi:hypothetical protein